ncbi:DUF3060 domain-containing protein [Pyxidicoccus sp. 3LG]
MSNKFGAAVFMVVACVLGPVTAGAQDDEAASVQVGKDGRVKVKSGGKTVETHGGTTRVQTSDGTRVHVGGGGVHVEADDDDETSDGDTSLSVVDSGRTATLDCGQGGEVSISGSSNKISLTGECKSVSVSGSDNKVQMETVGRIDVSGTDNAITWKKGLAQGKKPKISNSGVDNRVTQAR